MNAEQIASVFRRAASEYRRLLEVVISPIELDRIESRLILDLSEVWNQLPESAESREGGNIAEIFSFGRFVGYQCFYRKIDEESFVEYGIFLPGMLSKRWPNEFRSINVLDIDEPDFSIRHSYRYERLRNYERACELMSESIARTQAHDYVKLTDAAKHLDIHVDTLAKWLGCRRIKRQGKSGKLRSGIRVASIADINRIIIENTLNCGPFSVSNFR